MPSTPPSSPISGRNAARHLEHTQRVMNSPENRCIPTGTSVPSTSRAPPSNFISQLSSIPPYHLHDFQASSSTSTLAPPAIITSLAAPALPSHRQTHSSAQLADAYAALPSLNPTRPSNITLSAAFAPPPHRQTLSSSQLAAAYAALPPLPSSSRFRFRGPSLHSASEQPFTSNEPSIMPPANPQFTFVPHPVSVYIFFFINCFF